MKSVFTSQILQSVYPTLVFLALVASARHANGFEPENRTSRMVQDDLITTWLEPEKPPACELIRSDGILIADHSQQLDTDNRK